MDSDSGSAIGAIIGGLVGLVIGIGVYAFFCFCLKRIVEKAGGEPGILIWIPIAQYIPLLNVVGWETWKLVLFLIPLVNIVMVVLLFIEILKKLNKPPALVVMLFIPCVNFFFLPYLAFAN